MSEAGLITQGDFLDAVHGLSYYMIELPGGARAYVIEHGGRLALFPDSDGDSLSVFWTPAEYRKVLMSGEWNTGHLRLWKVPEFSKDGNTWFCRTPGDYSQWECQKAMDPGNYEIRKTGEEVILTSKGPLKDFSSGTPYETEFIRSFYPGESHDYAGVTSARVGFKNIIRSDAPLFQAWLLAQHHSGDENDPGTVIFPAERKAQMAVYMNKLGDDLAEKHLRVRGDHVSVKSMELSDRKLFKLAITTRTARKVDGCGTVMYLSKVPETNNRYQLAVMKSSSVPSRSKDVLEISSLDRSEISGLPDYLQGGRGGIFTFCGPAPKDPANPSDDYFLETELLGWKGEKTSTLDGTLDVYWGGPDAILDAAKAAGGMQDLPYVFGLND